MKSQPQGQLNTRINRRCMYASRRKKQEPTLDDLDEGETDLKLKAKTNKESP